MKYTIIGFFVLLLIWFIFFISKEDFSQSIPLKFKKNISLAKSANPSYPQLVKEDKNLEDSRNKDFAKIKKLKEEEKSHRNNRKEIKDILFRQLTGFEHIIIQELNNEDFSLVFEKIKEDPDHLKNVENYLADIEQKFPNTKRKVWTYLDRMAYCLNGELRGYAFLEKESGIREIWKINLDILLEDNEGEFKEEVDLKIFDPNKEIFSFHHKGLVQTIKFIPLNSRAIIIDPGSRYFLILFEDYLRNQVLYWGLIYEKNNENEKKIGKVFLKNLVKKDSNMIPSELGFPEKWEIKKSLIPN